MKIFPTKKTARIDVRMREMTIGECGALCGMRAAAHEATTTQFLRFVLEWQPGAKPLDPLAMTVQERALLVCHYLSVILPDGPNFALSSGETPKDQPAVNAGRLADFLEIGDDYLHDEVEVGHIGAEAVLFRPLLGVHAEMLEKFCSSRRQWIAGMMACQIRMESEDYPDLLAMTDVERFQWVNNRINRMSGMPLSQGVELHDSFFSEGAAAVRHFFDVWADDEGLVFRPKPGAGVSTLARFRCDPCIPERARSLFG